MKEAFRNVVILATCFLGAGAQKLDEFLWNVLPLTIEDIVEETIFQPANTNDSIQYSLYTRSNPHNPCFMEPTAKEFDHCPFDPRLDTKILIHGFFVKITTYKSFEMMKNALLNYGSYNVIYVDWTRYNGHPYIQAVSNTIDVGKKVAEFINFIMKHKKARSGSFHLIGHSLGAHISGIVGKNIKNLRRITGLDPAGPLYEMKNKREKLHYSDAKFVDIIHSSNDLTGLGLGKIDPMGHMDFYPNGGQTQLDACNATTEFNESEGVLKELESAYDVLICSHMMSIEFFLHSILDCDYLSTKCKDYESLPICLSNGNPKARMGFFAKRMRKMPRKSKFYLTTSGSEPFC